MSYENEYQKAKNRLEKVQEEADALKKEGYLIEEFGNRNMAFCSHCGLKDNFIDVTEEYVESHADGDLIQPILLGHGNHKPTTGKP